MENLIANYLNGNLTTAQAQARRHTLDAIRTELMNQGYSFEKATKTAEYLKKRGSFQAACDAR